MIRTNIEQWIATLLTPLSLSDNHLTFVTTAIFVLLTFAAAFVCSYAVRVPLSRFLQTAVKKTETEWDDRILAPSVMTRAGWLMFSIVVLNCSEFMLHSYPQHIPAVEKMLRLLVLAGGYLLASHLVTVVYNGLREEQTDLHGIAIIRNIVLIALVAVTLIMAASIIMQRNIAYVLSGLSAMAAVLMFVFRDSLLGMVAGVRLTVNKIIRHDDWISIPSHNADGRVEDLTITSVKVRNWDNSITTVPPNVLLTTGFKNMQEMIRRGSRQIKKAYHIDINSVRLLQPGELIAFADAPWARRFDLERPQVNLTLWRAWLRFAIEQHPAYRSEPRSFVRELPATPEGLPVEVHFFVDCIEWPRFEELQSDFTDNLLASLPYFSLRLFQRPSGADIAAN